MILKTLKTAAAIGLIFSATVVNASLIVDGGFEFGQAAGTQSPLLSSYGAWTTASNSVLLGMPFVGLPTIEGLNAMHVGNSHNLGYVEQNFATSIGTLYELTYSVIGWGGGVGSVSADLYNSSSTDLGVTLATSGGWVTNSFSFTASDTLTTLKLQNVTGASTIDDVSIIATTVPEPSILALIGLGIAGLGLFRRKIKS